MTDFKPSPEKLQVKRYRPANGSEGAWFMSKWCDKCAYDQSDDGDFCKIQCLTMALPVGDPDYPKEWTFNDDGKPICTAFSIFKKREIRCAKTIDMFQGECGK